MKSLFATVLQTAECKGAWGAIAGRRGAACLGGPSPAGRPNRWDLAKLQYVRHPATDLCTVPEILAALLQGTATWRKPGSSVPRHLLSSREQMQATAACQRIPSSIRRRQRPSPRQMCLQYRKTLQHSTNLLRNSRLSARTQLYSCRRTLMSRTGCQMQLSFSTCQVTCQMRSSPVQL